MDTRVGKTVVLGLALTLGLCAHADAAGGSQYLRGKIETHWTITSKYAEIRQGMLYLDGIGEKNRLAAFDKNNDYTDSALSATFRVEKTGKGEKPFGLIFGSTDSETYVAVEVRRGVVHLISVVGGKQEKEFGKYAIKDAGDAWQTVSFSCTASMVRVNYGGRLVFTANLPTRPTGKVGVYTEGARVWVKELDIKGKPARLPGGWTLVGSKTTTKKK